MYVLVWCKLFYSLMLCGSSVRVWESVERGYIHFAMYEIPLTRTGREGLRSSLARYSLCESMNFFRVACWNFFGTHIPWKQWWWTLTVTDKWTILLSNNVNYGMVGFEAHPLTSSPVFFWSPTGNKRAANWCEKDDFNCFFTICVHVCVWVCVCTVRLCFSPLDVHLMQRANITFALKANVFTCVES